MLSPPPRRSGWAYGFARKPSRVSLEPSSRGSYRLTEEYITTATDDVAQQLSKAGGRLAFVLNKALRRQ
jgi:hypothetical protein